MIRLATLLPFCLALGACGDVTLPPLPDLSALGLPGTEERPEVREFPVQDAACVAAVRRAAEQVNVRIADRTPGDAGTVRYLIDVGGGGQWACTSTAEGTTSGTGPVGGGLVTGGGETGAPLSAVRPPPVAAPAPAPASTPAPAPAPASAPPPPPSDPRPIIVDVEPTPGAAVTIETTGLPSPDGGSQAASGDVTSAGASFNE